MKIQCVKAECPVCKITGSIQLFMNRNREVRYARTRHYSHINKASRKPQFTYCKITDLHALETLLSQQNISLKTEAKAPRSIGQQSGFKPHDPQLRSLASIHQNNWASSSVRIEHQPKLFFQLSKNSVF